MNIFKYKHESQLFSHAKDISIGSWVLIAIAVLIALVVPEKHSSLVAFLWSAGVAGQLMSGILWLIAKSKTNEHI